MAEDEDIAKTINNTTYSGMVEEDIAKILT